MLNSAHFCYRFVSVARFPYAIDTQYIHLFAFTAHHLLYGFCFKVHPNWSSISVLESGSSKSAFVCDPFMFLASHCLRNVHNLKVHSIIVFCVFGNTLSGSLSILSNFLPLFSLPLRFFFHFFFLLALVISLLPIFSSALINALAALWCVSFHHHMYRAFPYFLLLLFFSTFRTNRNRNIQLKLEHTHT